MIFCSCNHERDGHQKPTILSYFIKTTQFEKSGVDEVLNYYGGYCYYSKGVEYSTDKPNLKYFELEISKSEIFDTQVKNFFIASSNVAYLFYKNIRNYDHGYQEIHVSIKSNNKEVEKASFKIEELELIYMNQNKLMGFVNLFANKKYDKILNLIDSTSSFGTSNKQNLKQIFVETDSIFGEININNPFQFAGFKSQSNNFEIVRYYGILIRAIKNCEFSIDFSNTKKDTLINAFDYKYY
ncbi:hypothetical protein GCM10007940_07710 [Portibacter lacus]|uniref:Uncharacterized protein n=2 Tax=Portibacter lacus TaxID=1099794 RepID=A0AA37SL07_9BACT|nr:hypothetical protein GCM10007940_07710 [Portibacter lacus]